MKRITIVLLSAVFIILLFEASASAQDKDKIAEKKIKIVIDEGTGEKTVLDTLFTGTSVPETIELNDGRVIFIGEAEDDIITVRKGEKIIVSMAVDDDGIKEKEEKIIITESDSLKWTMATTGDKEGKVFVYAGTYEKPDKHIYITTSGNKTTEWIAKEDEDFGETKYIIAKDGIVVTIESDDEDKVMKVAKDIEEMLGVKSDEGAHKEIVKEESSKTKKK